MTAWPLVMEGALLGMQSKHTSSGLCVISKLYCASVRRPSSCVVHGLSLAVDAEVCVICAWATKLPLNSACS